MDSPDSASPFQTTSWTLVLGARKNEADLEDLLARYWSPIYAFLRRRDHSADDAADLTQAFLTDVFLGRDLLSKADAIRGRFRSFLMSSIKNFVVDEHRRQHGRDRKNAPRFVPTDPALLGAAEPHEEDDPARAFDRQWAAAQISRVIERLQRICAEQGLTTHWYVFAERVIGPALNGAAPASLSEMVKDVGAHDAAEVSHMLYTVKRKARAVFYEVLMETVETPAEVDSELRELRRFLE